MKKRLLMYLGCLLWFVQSYAQDIHVLTPVGGEQLYATEPLTISWSSGDINNVVIEFTEDAGQS